MSEMTDPFKDRYDFPVTATLTLTAAEWGHVAAALGGAAATARFVAERQGSMPESVISTTLAAEKAQALIVETVFPLVEEASERREKRS